jgi:hypothetical protein
MIVIQTALKPATPYKAGANNPFLPQAPQTSTSLGPSSNEYTEILIIKVIPMIARLADGDSNGIPRPRREVKILRRHMLTSNRYGFTAERTYSDFHLNHICMLSGGEKAHALLVLHDGVDVGFSPIFGQVYPVRLDPLYRGYWLPLNPL